MEARHTFNGRVGAGTLKSVAGYNHYGRRHSMINNQLIRDKCPRCNREKTWEHVIQCEGVNSIKEKYLETLLESIRKVKGHEQINQEIQWIITDIKNYLYEQNEPVLTTQGELGMMNLFRGWITRNWLDINKSQNDLM